MCRCLAISSHQVCLKHAMEMFKYGPWAENGNCVVVKGAFSLLRLTHHPSKHIKFRHPHIQQSTQATMDIALPPITLALLPFFSCLRFPSLHHWITSQAPLPMIPSSPVTLTWWMSRPFKVHSMIPYPS